MNSNKKLLRTIILTIVGISAFVIAVFMNIVGMNDAIRKAPDSSAMAAFSVRTEEDSSGKKKTTKVDNDGKAVEESISVNAIPIINLNNGNWDRIKSRFAGFQLDENGNAIFDKEGYTLYCNGIYVQYVIFNENFEKDVVGNIKVGEDFKEIEKKLGEPTFKRSEFIAYKTKELYIFFYENEIVVYPNATSSNEKLEDFLMRYFEKMYADGRTRFLVEIREKFPDIVISQDEETDMIILSSLTRQITAKIDTLGNMEIEVYNGYKAATDKVKEYIDKKVIKENKEDLVEIAESERVRGV